VSKLEAPADENGGDSASSAKAKDALKPQDSKQGKASKEGGKQANEEGKQAKEDPKPKGGKK